MEKENKMKKSKKLQKKERVPLFLIFKDEGIIKTDVSGDINNFELYGFLKLFVELLGKSLREDIRFREDDEEIL